MNRRVARIVAVAFMALVLASASTPSAAFAASTKGRIYLGLGIYRARLGTADSTAKSRVGLRLVKTKKDTNYEGQVAYIFFFGKKRAGGVYDVQMYSWKNHKVWLFAVYGTSLKTSKGIHVGSTEATLKAAYGSSIRVTSDTDKYRIYTNGSARRAGTDFLVRKSTGKISEIDVRNWGL